MKSIDINVHGSVDNQKGCPRMSTALSSTCFTVILVALSVWCESSSLSRVSETHVSSCFRSRFPDDSVARQSATRPPFVGPASAPRPQPLKTCRRLHHGHDTAYIILGTAPGPGSKTVGRKSALQCMRAYFTLYGRRSFDHLILICGAYFGETQYDAWEKIHSRRGARRRGREGARWRRSPAVQLLH